MLLLFLIGVCTFGTVRSANGDHIESLSALEFGGEGWKECDNDGNCAAKFSLGFREDICSFSDYRKDIWGNRADDCWGIQGISEYGDFITRSFYEQEKDSSSNDGAGQYIAASVIRKTPTTPTTNDIEVEYSNILILPSDDVDQHCHAGDMVLTEHNDVLYFLFACTDWILVFNETAIVEYPSGKSVNGKNFYYRVYPEDVFEISDKGTIDGTAYDLTLSFISRNQGMTNQFWTGRFTEDSNAGPNVNLITVDFDSMSITAVEPYTVNSAPLRLQGITRIGENMLLTYDPDYQTIRGVSGFKNKYSNLALCPVNTETRVVSGEDCVTKCTVSTPYEEYRILQGSEVSADGTVYVGSEFGSPRGIWYEFGDFESLDGSECSSWDMVMPLPDVDAPILPRNRLKVPSSDMWLFIGVGMTLFCLTISALRRQTMSKEESWAEYSRV